ncbi:MAG: hypothetical protein P4L51_11035 [Puia sp.]|nr:hypothetical protein [Puia sp.]
MPLTELLKYTGCLVLAGCSLLSLQAQDTTSLQYQKMQKQYVVAVNQKVSAFNKQVDQYTGKALDKMIRQEKKMQQKVAKVDAVKAKLLFAYSIDSLQKFKTLIQAKTGKIGRFFTGRYFPYLDTMKQSLGFFNKFKGAMDSAGKMQSQLNNSMSSVGGMESRLATVQNINEYMKQREQVLQSQLSSFPGLSGNLVNLNKQALYYQAQIGEYKNVVQEPEKIEKLTVSTLEKFPAFQQYLQQHSQLAGIFASSSSFGSGLGSSLLSGSSLTGSGSSLAGGGLSGAGGSLSGAATAISGTALGTSSPIVNGLASRAALQQFIQSQAPSAGATANAATGSGAATGANAGTAMVTMLQQQTDKGGSALDKSLSSLTGKLPSSGGDSAGAGSIPDFTPDGQSLKSFGKRLEYGVNLQFGSSTNWMPASANTGLQLGYKLSDRSSVGIGVAYAMGLGTGWNHIRFSNQSLGLRSYVKWKPSRQAKIFLQGGSEWNYLTQFGGLSDLKNFNAWQASALLGIGKSFKISKKVSGSLVLLYDFLYDQHVPVTKPLLLRMGYNF